MSHRDTRYDHLIQEAERAGWRVVRTERGHRTFYAPDKRVPPIVGARSTDPHGYKNLRAYLRRHGVPV